MNNAVSSSQGSGQQAPVRGQLNQLMMGIIENGAHANVNRQLSAMSSSLYGGGGGHQNPMMKYSLQFSQSGILGAFNN